MMKIKPPESINDQVFGYLLEQIQTGEIGSGSRLIETQVAESLQASRTPVREAFRRLEQDGIVERLPQGGVRVTPVTDKTVEEIFGIRKVLEPYAIRLACQRIDNKDIQKLKQMARLAKDIINDTGIETEEKIKQLFKLNTQFHDIIYKASGSPYLVKLINQVRNIVLRLRVMGLRKDSAWHTAWQEHEQLIALFEIRDEKSVSELMKKHIENAKSDVATSVNGDPGKESCQK
jgi:GntR family transcriptional regulator, rspAB operon transcriptional repressor